LRVTVKVQVDASGDVTDAKLSSPGPSKYFANLASQAARRWKFTAPLVDGKSVPSAWTLKFEFRRSGTVVHPAQIAR
jgi:TonB family protein